MAFRTAGRQLEPTAIKWLRIVAAMSTPSDLVIGGGSQPSMFGDQSEMMLTGTRVTLELGDANGWSIMAGVDELLITSASSAAYKLLLGGVSSQPPIPATAASARRSSASPRVGTRYVCTNGDWSASPVFSCLWRCGAARSL